MCLSGAGEVQAGGLSRQFAAGQSVVLPLGEVHQIFNVGHAALEIVGIFGATPVVTLLPDGSVIDLPWRT